eukprot:5675562-Pyramimonas_sp.AAC.1
MAGALPEIDQGPGVGCPGAWYGGSFPAGVACWSGSRSASWGCPTCVFRRSPGSSAGRASVCPGGSGAARLST